MRQTWRVLKTKWWNSCYRPKITIHQSGVVTFDIICIVSCEMAQKWAPKCKYAVLLQQQEKGLYVTHGLAKARLLFTVNKFLTMKILDNPMIDCIQYLILINALMATCIPINNFVQCSSKCVNGFTYTRGLFSLHTVAGTKLQNCLEFIHLC